MADHSAITSPEASWFGVNLAFAVAGFWGGVISLSFIKNLTAWQGVMAVFTGVASASYFTPLAVQLFLPTDPGTAKENAIAFIIGLTAMNIIPGVIKLSEMWRRNPLSTLKGLQDGSSDKQ